MVLILGQELLDHQLETVGETWRDRVVDAPQNFEDQRSLILSFKRVSQRAHLVQYADEGPNVALVIVGLFLAELR